MRELPQMRPEMVSFPLDHQIQSSNRRKPVSSGKNLKIKSKVSKISFQIRFQDNIQSSWRWVCIPCPHYDDHSKLAWLRTNKTVHCFQRIKIARCPRGGPTVDLSFQPAVWHSTNDYCIGRFQLFRRQTQILFVFHSRLLRPHLQRPNIRFALWLT